MTIPLGADVGEHHLCMRSTTNTTGATGRSSHVVEQCRGTR